MRQVFVSSADAANEIAVFNIHHWAIVAVTVGGGWLAFESITEFHTWENQQPRTPRRVVFDGRFHGNSFAEHCEGYS